MPALTAGSRAPRGRLDRARRRTGDLLLHALAWPLLALASLAIALLPFSVVRRLLGEGRVQSVRLPAVTPRDTGRARRVGLAVQRVARHAPWRTDCYPQALGAHLQLRLLRVPHSVSFGLRRVDDALTAHAWVLAGDLAVTGGNPVDYTVVGTFSWLPRTRRPR